MMLLPSIQCALPFSLKVWTVQVPTTAGLATGLYTLVMQTPAATGSIFCRACLQSSVRGEDEELIAVQVRPTISSATDGSEFGAGSPSATFQVGLLVAVHNIAMFIPLKDILAYIPWVKKNSPLIRTKSKL